MIEKKKLISDFNVLLLLAVWAVYYLFIVIDLGVCDEKAGRLALSSWGLPDVILQRYHERNITTMFEWQAECLCTGNVLGKSVKLLIFFLSY